MATAAGRRTPVFEVARDESRLKGFLGELRRRRVFRTGGLYIVGAWLVMQVADVFFPAWGLPDAAINVLLLAASLGFPLALVFGWFYDVTVHGIVRTAATGRDDAAGRPALRRYDYVLLGALLLIAGLIAYDAVREILEVPRVAATRDGETGSSASSAKAANSIAVLPFANVSDDAANEYFCDGISEEILHKLAAFRDLRVIGRTSSFAFKGSDYGIPRISNLLGVRYLLQGSVRKQGNRLRISVQLVDDTGEQRWSEAFDRTPEDIFAIQSEIADVVATTVVPQIVPRHAAYYVPDLAAYEHYLKGREHLHTRDVLRARDELAMSVQIDPEFAEAQAEYAVALTLWEADPEKLARAQQVVDRALALRPDLARARAAQGLLLQSRAPPDYRRSEAELREVLRDEPEMTDAINWLAIALDAQGKRGEVRSLYEQGLRTDPMHAAIAANLSSAYLRAGDPNRAERTLLRLAEVPVPSPVIIADLYMHYRRTGRLVPMTTFARRLVFGFESDERYRAWRIQALAQSHALLGDPGRATAWAIQGADPAPSRDSPAWETWLSLRYLPAIWAGRYADALAVFEQTLAGLGTDPMAGSPHRACEYGVLQALAGDHVAAVRTLASLGGSPGDPLHPCPERGLAAAQALAWAYRQAGARELARPLLQEIEAYITRVAADGELHASDDIFVSAQNALLMGNTDLALERLRQSVDAGWREYYVQRYDPRWAMLDGNPRYQVLMAEVKADVDRQRVELERLDAERGVAQEAR